MTKVVIEISGGVLQGVYSDKKNPDIDFILIDHDNILSHVSSPGVYKKTEAIWKNVHEQKFKAIEDEI